MNILIDALSMSFKFNNLYALMEDLNLLTVIRQPMRRQYYAFGEFYEGILVAYNKDENGDISDTFLDISGKGCRTVELLNPDFDWHKFLTKYDYEIRNKQAHISRIDVSCDLLEDEVPMEIFFRYSYNDAFVCRSKLHPKIICKREETVYFGSEKSGRLLRIYNKALEQCIPDMYWIRMEFQLRNDNATSFYLNWFQLSDIGKLYSGMMLDYLRFVDVPKGMDIKEIKANRNHLRLPTARWWQRILGDAERIKQLYLPEPEFTIERLERYLEKQSFSSLKAYIIAHDGDITKLMEGVDEKKLNHKQRVLLQRLGKIEKYEYEE